MGKATIHPSIPGNCFEIAVTIAMTSADTITITRIAIISPHPVQPLEAMLALGGSDYAPLPKLALT